MKKGVLAGVMVFVLLLVIGGVFLFLRRNNGSRYATTPTTWSQEGDYEIKTEGGKTTVTNAKAGYSFEVPEGWKVEKSEGSIIGEIMLNLLSPDVVFDNKKRLEQGCFSTIATVFQKSEVLTVKNIISSLEKEKNNGAQEVLTIQGKQAFKERLTPENLETKNKFGEVIHFQMPLSEATIFDFWMRLMPQQETQCLNAFDSFSNSIRFD